MIDVFFVYYGCGDFILVCVLENIVERVYDMFCREGFFCGWEEFWYCVGDFGGCDLVLVIWEFWGVEILLVYLYGFCYGYWYWFGML